MTDQGERRTPVRAETGVPGLDGLLDGGVLRGASCLIAGEPGTGKTTLGNQVAFHAAAHDGVALFVTVGAEAHDRMLVHLAGFDFFEPEAVGQRVHYLSLIEQITEGGLPGALAELRRLVRAHGATVLVIDGSARFEDFAESRRAYRAFIAQLIAELAILGCTTYLLAQPDMSGEAMQTVGTLVDTIIAIENRTIGVRDIRLARIVKQRGSDPLGGLHEFTISRTGVEVHPRLEARPSVMRPERPSRRRRLSLGIDGLDALLQGGVLTGSTTLLAGPPGIGKTTLGLHFIAEGAHAGERGLIATFGESPERLVTKADALGLELGEHVSSDRVHLVWQPRTDRPLDAWAGQLMAHVAARKPQRLLIDGLTEMVRLTPFPNRLPAFLGALGHLLRQQGVATILTAETSTAEAAGLEIPYHDAVAALDNVLLLRYVEPRSRLHRLISVLRVRESGFDPTVREFSISDHGIEVASSGSSAESVLADVARLGGPSPSGERRESRTGDATDDLDTADDPGRR